MAEITGVAAISHWDIFKIVLANPYEVWYIHYTKQHPEMNDLPFDDI